MTSSRFLIPYERDNQNGRGLELPDRALRLKTGNNELAFCGPGPAYASVAYLDNVTGAVVVLFVAELLSVNDRVALFRPVNEALENAGRAEFVFVEVKNLHNLISAGRSSLVGPIATSQSGYLYGANAWSL